MIAVCAGCGQRPCYCLNEGRLMREAIALLRRVHGGVSDPKAVGAWLQRHQQSRAEDAALVEARRKFRAEGRLGIARAVEFLSGWCPTDDIGGTDQAVKAAMARNRYRVRLTHVALARQLIARGWLSGRRPPVRARQDARHATGARR